MKISRHKMTFILNALMMTLMFVGYVLTTGLEVVTSDAVKFVVRGLVAVIAISIILHGRMIQTSIVLTIYLFLIFWVINQNEIAANLLFLIVIVSSINRLSEKDAAVVFLVSSAAAVLFHILLLSAGIVSTSAVQVGERERSALGFANANQFALVYLTLICSAFFVYKQVKTKWALLVLFGSLALSGWMMKIADSRTSMFSVVILLTVSFFWFILSKSRVARKLFILGMACAPIAACTITYFITINNDPLLDIALSFRPRLFFAFLNEASWQDFLLGWKIDGDNVDNGYLMLLSSVGFPASGIVILAISKRIYQSNPELFPILVVVLIASVFESFLVRPEIPLSIMFFCIIFRKPYTLLSARPLRVLP